MAGAPPTDQALSLLAAANNHGDLAVKMSSLKQAKDILLSIEPSLAAELFPYLVELQSSPESLVRKSLLDAIEEIGLKAMEHSSVFMPVLLALLKDVEPTVARQSIVIGTKFFCSVLEELALQFHRRGKIERWLEELWMWIAKFKDAVFAIALEPGSVGTRLLALKFLETYVLLFTSDTDDFENPVTEASRQAFNISWLVGGHPVLDPVGLVSEANRTLDVLLNLLRSSNSLPGSLTITVVNCLTAIARKRPLHYSTVLSALLDFDPDFETVKGYHVASVQYSLRTALLGFLRCTHPAIIESRERLLRALRAMNAGDAADQVIRQVDKMIKNTERASRDARLGKEDQLSSQLPVSGDLLKRRFMTLDNEEPVNGHEVASKRIRYGPDSQSALAVQVNDSGQDSVPVNGVSPVLDGQLTPVEQMIAMIGALLAEGERGAESLEILISKIHPDLLADIVITNMKHLPKTTPPLTRLGNLSATRQMGSLSSPTQVVSISALTSSVESPDVSAQAALSSTTATNSSLSDTPPVNTLPADSKRDPRRDPRRLDPRRVTVPAGVPSIPTAEDTGALQSEFDANIYLSKHVSLPVVNTHENPSTTLISKIKSEDKILESPLVSSTDQPTPKEDILDRAEEIDLIPEVDPSSDPAPSPVDKVDEDSVAMKFSDDVVTNGVDTPSFLESDQHSPTVSNASEDNCQDLPLLPSYVELTQEQERSLRKLAIEQIIESYKHSCGTDCSEIRMALLARLVAQIGADDDIVMMLKKHVVVEYQRQKAKSLLDSFPASDKSFSKLFGEVPLLPDSALKLLDELCYADVTDLRGKDVRDVERVTQGLGAVWILILGRPLNRQSCLDIALKCAVHSQDEIRARAIRLVANKLYQLSYISDSIEQFARNMLLAAVDQHVSDIELSQSGFSKQRVEGEVESQETSTSGSQVSEPGTSENDSVRSAQPLVRNTSMSLHEAQRLISLFFALCTKKPNLLQLVFNNYCQAPKSVKQAFHRHIPILIRSLGSSCSELLHIISDPPQGSENLLTLVLEILTQETTPSSDLIATVKHLYETKLKDVTILIPMLSSLSKNEVLPIFPRLVELPLEKFQTALAHILQGSAHMGPALTPVEVLVAIHHIVPEKDGLALKKITDVCSACFEQRTVFTQQVLAKALNHMVDQTPLPLLFMRTVIQAIDAFPTLVDFVMEILSKLVTRQVWRMPKLWVGFLKCVSQTQPHSFDVLLQLPPPQLESALSKYSNLRGPLTAHASQPSIRSSVPRSMLAVLGIANETHMQQPYLPSSLHSADSSSSVRGATST
ncbi:symplekin isoform X2 [Quercus lobata]|uniref:symplekin isoform X2 n=1 Tax=Quercus lobata TaxID=97700 RepID=UPI001246C17E|nr:symplekin isoform X2 [Quercus lobata]